MTAIYTLMLFKHSKLNWLYTLLTSINFHILVGY